MPIVIWLLIVNSSSTPAQDVERSTNHIFISSNWLGFAHVALHTSHSQKLKLSLPNALASEKMSGKKIWRGLALVSLYCVASVYPRKPPS